MSKQTNIKNSFNLLIDFCNKQFNQDVLNCIQHLSINVNKSQNILSNIIQTNTNQDIIKALQTLVNYTHKSDKEFKDYLRMFNIYHITYYKDCTDSKTQATSKLMSYIPYKDTKEAIRVIRYCFDKKHLLTSLVYKDYLCTLRNACSKANIPSTNPLYLNICSDICKNSKHPAPSDLRILLNTLCFNTAEQHKTAQKLVKIVQQEMLSYLPQTTFQEADAMVKTFDIPNYSIYNICLIEASKSLTIGENVELRKWLFEHNFPSDFIITSIKSKQYLQQKIQKEQTR